MTSYNSHGIQKIEKQENKTNTINDNTINSSKHNNNDKRNNLVGNTAKTVMRIIS